MKDSIVRGELKGTIVCIHGNSSSNKVFTSILNCTKIQQTKITLDLPGHGSNLENYKNHSDFSMLFFKNKLIDYISKIDDDILLVGNSLGGHLAIEIANQINKLKGLVIFGTPPLKKPINFKEAFIPIEALQTFLTENPPEEAIQDAAKIVSKNNNSVATIISDFKKTNPLVRRDVAKDIQGNNLENEHEIFIQLKIPKFIIAGELDYSINLNYLKQITEDCNNNCELIKLKNCGHYPSLEKPNEFIEVLSDITKKIF